MPCTPSAALGWYLRSSEQPRLLMASTAVDPIGAKKSGTTLWVAVPPEETNRHHHSVRPSTVRL
jgi:hypothetical protein